MKKNEISSRNSESVDQGNQIFSVGGTPSFRLNRREQATSNVFPAGCMGSRSGEEASTSTQKEIDPEIANENEEDYDVRQSGPINDEEETPELDEAKMDEAGEGYVWKRNPLTGQGVEEDKPKSHKKGIRKKLNKWVW